MDTAKWKSKQMENTKISCRCIDARGKRQKKIHSSCQGAITLTFRMRTETRAIHNCKNAIKSSEKTPNESETKTKVTDSKNKTKSRHTNCQTKSKLKSNAPKVHKSTNLVPRLGHKNCVSISLHREKPLGKTLGSSNLNFLA